MAAVVPEHLQLPAWGAHAWQQEAESWLDESSREINLGDEDRPMWNLSARGRHVVTAVLEATSQNAGLRTGEQAGLTFPAAGLKVLATDKGAKIQQLHYDYSAAGCAGKELYYRSALWGAHAAFEIVAQADTPSSLPVTIRVGPRHVLYFRSDFRHAGGSHVTHMPRFHGYEVPRGVEPPFDSVFY